MARLSREFYLGDTVEIAQALLGKYLVRRLDGEMLAGRITETEAYVGRCDKACHAYNYRRTPRTSTLFAPPGTAYVYLIYGMYYCFNIVAAGPEIPHAILIRAAEPVFGLSQMTARRKAKSPLTPKAKQKLLAGPGKLCQHLGIDRSFYGEDLCGLQEGTPTRVLVLADPKAAPIDVLATPRIHIDYAQEAKDFLYRFIDPQSPSLSQP